jgi:hypothetical protein
MTAGYGLAGAPSSVTIVHAVAPSVYREVAIASLSQRVLPGAFERLERSDAKVSRAVLRGPGASNGPWLPDRSSGSSLCRCILSIQASISGPS